jgi:dTMP kinase
MVAIEGVDAVGKRTQSLLLSRWLRKNGVRTLLLSFPDYTTPIGKEIRSFLSGRRTYPIELQHLLFAANRWEKSRQIISFLERGGAVIANRYTESNLAYGKANGLDVDWLANLEKGLPTPNLVAVLSAPLRSLRSRRPIITKDTFERSSALQESAQNAYTELAPERGWKLIDAAGSVREVQAVVLTAMKEALAKDKGIEI